MSGRVIQGLICKPPAQLVIREGYRSTCVLLHLITALWVVSYRVAWFFFHWLHFDIAALLQSSESSESSFSTGAAAQGALRALQARPRSCAMAVTILSLPDEEPPSIGSHGHASPALSAHSFAPELREEFTSPKSPFLQIFTQMEASTPQHLTDLSIARRMTLKLFETADYMLQCHVSCCPNLEEVLHKELLAAYQEEVGEHSGLSVLPELIPKCVGVNCASLSFCQFFGAGHVVTFSLFLRISWCFFMFFPSGSTRPKAFQTASRICGQRRWWTSGGSDCREVSPLAFDKTWLWVHCIPYGFHMDSIWYKLWCKPVIIFRYCYILLYIVVHVPDRSRFFPVGFVQLCIEGRELLGTVGNCHQVEEKLPEKLSKTKSKTGSHTSLHLPGEVDMPHMVPVSWFGIPTVVFFPEISRTHCSANVSYPSRQHLVISPNVSQCLATHER